MAADELRELLGEAVRGLEEAIRALASKDEGALSAKVWKAASDVEYATFLMSLVRGESEDEWKRQWKLSRDVDVGATLVVAQDLLREAVKDLDSRVEEVYRKAWLARGHVLNVQNKLDKAMLKEMSPQRLS